MGRYTLWVSRAILGQSSWARRICTSCHRKSEGVHGSRFISPHKTLITQKDHQLAAPPPHTHTPSKGHSGKYLGYLGEEVEHGSVF